MSRLKRMVHKARLMPVIKPLAERSARLAGMCIVPESKVPTVGWLGLPNLPIRTVLDIGALRGRFAAETLAPRFPQAVIHSFEPSPEAFPDLKTRAAASGRRIVAHNFGLGDKAEMLTLHSTLDSPGSSSLLPSTLECTTAFPNTARTKDMSVEIKVLDEVARILAPAIEDDLLIKIDVQGFEDRVIRGGRQTIGRARAVVIEVQHALLYEGQPTFRDIFTEFDNIGLAFTGVLEQFAAADGRTLYYDAVFIRP